VFAATNYATVSNLSSALDVYGFSCVSSNAAGESAESAPAIKRLITLLERDTIAGPLRPFTTPVFEPTNSGRFFWPSNWDAAALLKKD
jgi:hypothetical protein